MVHVKVREHHDIDIVDLITPFQEPSDNRRPHVHEDIDASCRHQISRGPPLNARDSRPGPKNVKFHIKEG